MVLIPRNPNCSRRCCFVAVACLTSSYLVARRATYFVLIRDFERNAHHLAPNHPPPLCTNPLTLTPITSTSPIHQVMHLPRPQPPHHTFPQPPLHTWPQPPTTPGPNHPPPVNPNQSTTSWPQSPHHSYT